ncbi:hypothetical protein [Caudoviricetes sp.]|nr:hypothetical protein [Caudoviricetes sp.]
MNIERDPAGLSPSDKGAKMDGDKPDLHLVLGDFSRALMAVGSIGTFGAKKYSKSGWLSVPDGKSRYKSAGLRHYFYEEIEGLLDKDSGLLHAAHAAWNSLAYLELLLRDIEKNDKCYSEVSYKDNEEFTNSSVLEDRYHYN